MFNPFCHYILISHIGPGVREKGSSGVFWRAVYEGLEFCSCWALGICFDIYFLFDGSRLLLDVVRIVHSFCEYKLSYILRSY